jgi:LysM repeat protein
MKRLVPPSIYLNIAIGMLLLLLSWTPSRSASASHSYGNSSSAIDVITQINSYRTQNGLPAYQIHQDLMTIAQAQSDHQAAIGSVTHTGPGGTSPRERAQAVGYGGGGTIWISEIIYGGSHATTATAMSWWKNSQVHNQAMLSSRYQEIGAGVAASGDGVYFTAVMAVVAGGSSDGDGGSSSSLDTADSPPANPVVPVAVAEPRADGSVVHEVQVGQTLWSIAAVYGVPLKTLTSLNNLSESEMIFPGQEILIQPPHTPTPTRTSTPQRADETADSTEGQSDSSKPTSVTSPLPATETPRAVADRLDAGGPNASGDGSDPLAERPGSGISTIGIIAIGMLALYAVVSFVLLSLRAGDDSDQGVK